jgi:sugar lactone lactonase YvrE
MNRWIAASGVLLTGTAILAARAANGTSTTALREVFRDDTFQLTGVTVSRTGRVFVNYPRWSDVYLNAVVEVLPDGTSRPFPDETWNRWDRKPGSARDHFVCIQSVVVDSSDALWVLDPAAPMLTTPVPNGPKLVKIDLATNRVVQVIPFGADVVHPDSYLNDVRVDVERHVAYITDSGAGGIVVVDLASGRAHRTLDGHPSVKADPSVRIVIDGKPVLDAQGKPPQFNSDGIALSANGEYLYYQPITANSLYRVRTDVLRSGQHGTDVAAAVERYASTFPVDGLWMDKRDRIHLSDLTHTAVSRLRPDRGVETLLHDPRLQWPDTFSQGPDGAIYVTTSRINESPTYNKGKNARTGPFQVFKFTPPE